MEKLITQSTELFNRFLIENESAIKNHSAEDLLISFVFDAGEIDSEGKVDAYLKNSKISFYFEQPEIQFKIFAVDEILDITESGDGRFAITDKKLKGWKDKIVSNRENFACAKIPLFVGGMKFMVEHPDNEWKDFQDSTWFVPAIMFFNNGNDNLLVLNFLHNPKKPVEQLVNHFKTKLENIFRQKSNSPASLPHIRKIAGDTPKDKKKWKGMIYEALERIEERKIQKVVLARKVTLFLSAEPGFEGIINSLKGNYPGCSIFIFRKNNSTFFGATPETLGRFKGNIVEFDALAGSAPRGKDEKEDNEFEKMLLSSEKDIAEHNFVVEHIKESLSGFSNEIEIHNGLSVKKLSNIQHLHTFITAKPENDFSIFNLLKELYPTPAICGSPKEAALHVIKKSETFRRGLYSGIIGFFNFDNEGEFVVALRSAISAGTKVVAYAGSGIVHNSDPGSEFSETELKLKPVMTLFKDEN